MRGPPNDPLMSLKCQTCKNNDLSCCKNGLYEVIHPPQVDPCSVKLKDLHCWRCYNLNRRMKVSWKVDTLDLFKSCDPPIVSHQKIWHHWLLKNNREFFLGSIVICGWLNNVLHDRLMLFLSCTRNFWWICGIFLWIHFHYLTSKPNWRGVQLWKTSTLLFSMNFMVTGSIYVTWYLTHLSFISR